MRIRYRTLSEDQYQAAYSRAFEKVDVPTESDKDRMREAISSTQQLVVDALSAKWEDQEDFAVGWDFNYCYHVCGGIYSDRIVSPSYLSALVKALASAPEPRKWTYHTACETDRFEGEFFVRESCVYASELTDLEMRSALGFPKKETAGS